MDLIGLDAAPPGNELAPVAIVLVLAVLAVIVAVLVIRFLSR